MIMARARLKTTRKSHPILNSLLPGLQAAGEARARAMFGGWGVYLDDVIVGLIAWDRLYFRVDDGNRPNYQAAGTAPFIYEGRSGKPIEMPYWEVPAEVLADPAQLCDWALKARRASVAARRNVRKQRSAR
jgi:DNA transformation protein